MTQARSPMRSPSDLKGRSPVDKYTYHVRPWWEDYALGRLSRRKAQLIDDIIDSGDEAPRLFMRLTRELDVAPALARKWIRVALVERGRHKEKD